MLSRAGVPVINVYVRMLFRELFTNVRVCPASELRYFLYVHVVVVVFDLRPNVFACSLFKLRLFAPGKLSQKLVCVELPAASDHVISELDLFGCRLHLGDYLIAQRAFSLFLPGQLHWRIIGWCCRALPLGALLHKTIAVPVDCVGIVCDCGF